MNPAHVLAIGAGIIRRPSPALWRKKVASAKFRAVIRCRLRHRSTAKPAKPAATTIAHSVFEIKQPREVKLRIVRRRRLGHYSGKRNQRNPCRGGDEQRHEEPDLQRHALLISAPAAWP